MDIRELGWSDAYESDFGPFRADGLLPARVVRQVGRECLCWSSTGEGTATVRGHLTATGEGPAVGDWVALRDGGDEQGVVIEAVLSRRSAFSRKVAGARTREQVIAVNIDTVFVTSGLDRDHNPRRIERYLTLAWNSGALPVIVLTKADLCEDLEAASAEIAAVAPGVAFHPVSALEQRGLEALEPYLAPRQTIAFLGSSGVGKSTLINRLLGEERLAVGEISSRDGRGQHTTTRRELLMLGGGAMVIDTPGLRELAMWGDEEGLAETFKDVVELAEGCRFRDCSHVVEPGCAILDALDRGELDEGRYRSYLSLRDELGALANKRVEQKREGRRFHKMIREVNRWNPKRR